MKWLEFIVWLLGFFPRISFWSLTPEAQATGACFASCRSTVALLVMMNMLASARVAGVADGLGSGPTVVSCNLPPHLGRPWAMALRIQGTPLEDAAVSTEQRPLPLSAGARRPLFGGCPCEGLTREGRTQPAGQGTS